MPSIVSGLNSKATKPLMTKTMSTGALQRVTENPKPNGQMTPGKRKASDMDVDHGSSASHDRPVYARGFGLPLDDTALEDSPRVKRMRVTSGQSRAMETTRATAEGHLADRRSG